MMLTFRMTGALACAAALWSQDYSLGPDSQPRPGVPQGALTKHTLPPGKRFPGTPHNYSIYVPAQYDAQKPAPFMIFLDGSGAINNNVRANVVFDNLIHKRELPPMIGIFIDPGVLPAASEQARSRFERVFQYDSLSDRFARFLIEELIPAVGSRYNLSGDPNDRGLYGVSTGAVGAFAAAWNRPDQFRRVLSFIGTFVAMKGADGLPALIRKTEAKPIRIFLQAGKNDHIVPNQPFGTFYAGSWPINNQVMYEAFQFAGYDVKFVLGEEAHNMRHGAAILPDALRWLWREHPKPIVVEEPAALGKEGWDPRGKVSSIVSAAEAWRQVGESYQGPVSPTADRDGNVFFADRTANRIYKSDSAGKVTVFRESAAGIAAIAAGPDSLYAAQPARRRIVAYDARGKERVIARNAAAASIAVTAQSGVYFIDAGARTVGYVDPSGKVRSVYGGGEIAQPAGIALSPDQAMVIVTDAQSRFSWSFQISADGSLINGEPFYRLEMPESGWLSGVRAAVEDSIGQVYFASPLGIQMCEANGRVAAILNPPGVEALTGVTFGGRELDWIYVTAGAKVYRRHSKVKGVPAWAPAKLPRPPL